MARIVRPHVPDASGSTDGLAWNLFVPSHGRPTSGVVVLHGAGSRKENHHDYARAAAGLGVAALVADLPGHGESARPMDAGVLEDVSTLTGVLRSQADVVDVGLRGSSLGGYLALVAAQRALATGVVAFCPPSAQHLRRGLDAGRWDFAYDEDGVRGVLADADAGAAVAGLRTPILLIHAAGDEVVPVEHSRELEGLNPAARLLELPGGDHRSAQHDPELQSESVRFLRRAARAN